MHATPDQAQPQAGRPDGVLETDAVVVGAGPAGLFQVFQLGLLEIRAHVVDALPFAGGQPAELYPDKPIYDLPGIPVCTGRELAQSLLKQVEPLKPPLHLGQTVTVVERQPDGRLRVETSRGTRFLTRTLFIAAGVGAFEPRRLKVEELATFEDTQVFHGARDPSAFAGRNLVIVGGDEPALAQALACAAPGPQQAASVTLVHRRDGFQAEPGTVEEFRRRVAAGTLRFVVGQVTGCEARAGRLAAVQVTTPEATTERLPLDALQVLLGVSPRLGPVTGWGLALERKQLVVDTEKFSTSEAGIFAVGDVVTYPGKRKLIVCSFHECVLAAYAAAAYLAPDRGPIPLEYTTTSTRLHRVLGVQPPGTD